MTNRMSEVAKMLDLELDEDFEITELLNYTYRLTSKGLMFIEKSYPTGEWILAGSTFNKLMAGEYSVEREWKPKQGEKIYYLDFNLREGYNFRYCDLSSMTDANRIRSKVIAKTLDEIIHMRDRILELVRGE